MNIFEPTPYKVGDEGDSLTIDAMSLIYQDRQYGETGGVLPRKPEHAYGSDLVRSMGMSPIDESPDELIQVEDFEEAIAEAHAKKMFPMYAMEDSGLFENWLQFGNYCWAWGATGAVMALRLMEGQPPISLAPSSLGWTVNWRNSGGYLVETINAIATKGIAPLENAGDIHSRNERDFDYDKAKHFTCNEWFDGKVTKDLKQVQYMLTALHAGRPEYIAYDWWSHALMCVGMNYNRNARYKVDFIDFNSHDDGIIILEGSRGMPDAYFAPRASSLSDLPESIIGAAI